MNIPKIDRHTLTHRVLPILAVAVVGLVIGASASSGHGNGTGTGATLAARPSTPVTITTTKTQTVTPPAVSVTKTETATETKTVVTTPPSIAARAALNHMACILAFDASEKILSRVAGDVQELIDVWSETLRVGLTDSATRRLDKVNIDLKDVNKQAVPSYKSLRGSCLNGTMTG